MTYIYHTQGLVLKKQDFGEYNNLYTLYTKDLGKLHAVCRGSKKISSKLAGHLEPFSLCNLVLVRGRNFFQIIGASQEKFFGSILETYRKMIYASFCFEVTDILIKELEKEEHVFNLIMATMEAIDKKQNNSSAISYAFAFQLVHFLGFTPQTHSCLKCNKNINENESFYCVFEGGLICDNCSAHAGNQLIKISKDNILILRALSEYKKPFIDSIQMSPESQSEFEHLVSSILQFYTEKRLRTENFF